jgi:hypothetical protein
MSTTSSHQAQLPVSAPALPRSRVASLGEIFPGLAFVIPQAVVVIATGVDESQKFAVRNQVAGWP